MKKLVKSPERLAMEIKGKSCYRARQHLERYGLSEAEAAEVVALHRGSIEMVDSVVDSVADIAESIGQYAE